MKLNQENLKFMLLINPFHWLDQNIKSPFLLPYIFYDVLSENLMAVKYPQVDIILFSQYLSALYQFEIVGRNQTLVSPWKVIKNWAHRNDSKEQIKRT